MQFRGVSYPSGYRPPSIRLAHQRFLRVNRDCLDLVVKGLIIFSIDIVLLTINTY